MSENEPGTPPQFRRKVSFGASRYHRGSKRYLIILIALLVLTLCAMFYLSSIGQEDSAGRRFLDRYFGPTPSGAGGQQDAPTED